MTADALTEMIKYIAANWRYTYKDCPKEVMERMMVSWHESFRDYEDEEVMKAFRICLRTCKQPPTVADIVEKIEKARDLKRPSKTAVWERLMQAVNQIQQVVATPNGFRALYVLKNSECRRIFAELPTSVQKWLGFDAFISYATMSNTQLGVERTRFMKEIDDLRNTIREMRQIELSELLTPAHLQALREA